MIPASDPLEVTDELREPGSDIVWRVVGLDAGWVFLSSGDEDVQPRVERVVHVMHEWRHADTVDITNLAMVSAGGGFGDDCRYSIINIGHVQSMTREQALVTAAWLVALTDPLGRDFPDILEQVCAT